jgi:hypothetical protein
MPSKAKNKQTVCPFTLEPLEYCSNLRAAKKKKICPFSLGPCVLQGKSGKARTCAL